MKHVGYLWLKERFSINSVDYWVSSLVRERGTRRTEVHDGINREIYRAADWPGDHWTNHLEFALKREGLHLELLRKLFPQLAARDVAQYVQATPTGRFARLTWYL